MFGMCADASETIPSRISVSSPYYALDNLSVPELGVAEAGVPVQRHTFAEVAPLGLAEAGRHLAILGSCAAASLAADNARRFYLARRAVITWAHSTSTATAGGELWARARAALPGRRAARAVGELRQHGAPIAFFRLGYDVLAEPVFRRVFAHTARPVSVADDRNPYARGIALHRLRLEHAMASARIHPRASDCVGHFDGYPMLPVAVLGGAMVDVASCLLDVVTDGRAARWMPVGVALQADRLVPAGKAATIHAHHARVTGDEHTVTVGAWCEEQQAATITLRALIEP